MPKADSILSVPNDQTLSGPAPDPVRSQKGMSSSSSMGPSLWRLAWGDDDGAGLDWLGVVERES